MVIWKRTLRTPHSERYLGFKDGREVAAIDLHHLENGTSAGTVWLLEDAQWKESDIPELLREFDDAYLPGVDLDAGSLSFTVVMGKVIGNFEAVKEG